MEKLKIICLLALFGCSQQTERLHISGLAMTMPYTVQITAKPSDKKAITQTINRVFDHIDTTYNRWNPRSHFEYDAPLIAISQSVKELTEGAFDPLFSGTWDFDGIVKGYAVDLIAESLEKEGFCNFYVEWAGEIVCRGRSSPERPWRVAINGTDQIVDLCDQAIATSGDTFHREVIDQKVITHIYDPHHSQFLEVTEGSIAFVTVRAPTCHLADALATAAMVNPELVLEICERKPGVDIWIYRHPK